MYKIEFTDIDAKIKDYLTTNGFMADVGALMQHYLTCPEWEYTYRGSKKIILKVENDSVTYRFLMKYSQQPYLRQLLAGDIDVQMEIIKDVYEGVPDDSHPPITFTEAFVPIKDRIKQQQAIDPDFDNISHDDFNSIMRHIFERTIYDGTKSPRVDKSAHVKRLGLRVCPYCGRNYIYGLTPERNGKDVKVKPQIDHLLPKSIYPFLAANFYNLIPSCTQCNLAPAKGDQDTLTSQPSGVLRIQHPYHFDDAKITFRYNPKSEQALNADEMNVLIDYHGNNTWEKGYHELFFLDDFYKHHNVEVHDIYIKLKSWYYDGAKKAYESIGIPVDYVRSLPLLLFGYHFTKEESVKRILYKFTHDIYQQMIEDFNRGKLR